jgi:hypothetical protein
MQYQREVNAQTISSTAYHSVVLQHRVAQEWLENAMLSLPHLAL